MLRYILLLLGPGLFISLLLDQVCSTVGGKIFRTIGFSYIICVKSFANLNLFGVKKDQEITEKGPVQEIIVILK